MPKQHPWYPLFIDVEGRRVVIVGGGSVAGRKAEALAGHGARAVVISPAVSGETERLSASGAIEWRPKRFEEDDLADAVLAFASTDDPDVNARVADAARRRGIPVNVADDLDLCDFIVPAVVESGSIQIAVSTGGRSPALARKLKEDLQAVVGPEYGAVNDLLGALREPAIASPSLPHDADRRRFFQTVLESGLLELLRQGKSEEAAQLVKRLCREAGVQWEG